MVGHMMGQTQFGHVTFPWSRASKVPESRFVTLTKPLNKIIHAKWVKQLQMDMDQGGVSEGYEG